MKAYIALDIDQIQEAIRDYVERKIQPKYGFNMKFTDLDMYDVKNYTSIDKAIVIFTVEEVKKDG